MITPVPEVRPRVMLIRYLPVNSGPRNAVGVKTVNCRCIHKYRNHTRDKARETVTQRLPVLEDVSPITFITAGRVALVIVHLY